MPCLSPAQIRDWRPFRAPRQGEAPALPPALPPAFSLIQQRLRAAGQWNPWQLAGRRWAIGCVALEISQRCNLDCTLCYLSEISESVHDVPLPEVFARIEMIHRHFGPETVVQVTGGDPTLRRKDELAAIVRKISSLGMKPALMTNGIRATRELLAELAECGLVDVVFHVDMTQQRRGYHSESDLNRLRRTYIERARGLPLAVFFNTTVFADNFAEIPGIVRFFRRHADAVNMAAFQLQADTGRGTLHRRAPSITLETVARQISAGAGIEIYFDGPQVGHRDCNRYAVCLAANGRLFNVFDDSPLFPAMFAADYKNGLDRRHRGKALRSLLRALLANPRQWGRALGFAGRMLWRMAPQLALGRVSKISFFIHNFMDAGCLDEARCQTCSFMVATSEGPISMCVYNAKRDAYLLKPIALETPAGSRWWNPLTGSTDALAQPAPSGQISLAERPLRG